MPQIKRYEPGRVKSSIIRQPTLGQPASDGLAQLGTGIANLGKGLQHMRQRASLTEAEEAMTNFERDKNDLFFDPEAGYFNSQGKVAFDGAKVAGDALDKLKKAHASNLSTPEARNAFSKIADRHVTQGKSSIMRHASKGLQAWEIASAKSQTENTIENASLYHNDPKKLSVQRELGRQTVMEGLELEGLSGDAEIVNERLQTFESSFAKATISAATLSSSEAGQESLNKYGDRLEGALKLQLQEKIDLKIKQEKTAIDASVAVTQANGLIAEYGEGHRAEINAEVLKIKDPTLQKKVRSEVTAQLLQIKYAREEDEHNAVNEAEKFMRTSGTLEMFKGQNPELWEKIPEKMKRSLASGKHVVTDNVLMSELMQLPAAKLAEIDPNSYSHRLDSKAQGQLWKAVTKARNGETDFIGQTRNARMNVTVDQLFGKKSKWNDKKRAQVNAFYEVVTAEVDRREAESGKKVTREEFDKILNGFATDAVVEGRVWDSEYEIKEIDAEDVSVLGGVLKQGGYEINTQTLIDLRRVRDFLSEKGYATTPENLLKAYAQGTGE